MACCNENVTIIGTNTENEIDKLVYTEFQMRGKYEYIEYGPQKYFLTDRYLQFKERLDNFQVYDDDIWVVSFPRSGTTWTQQMVHGILTLNYSKNINLNRVFPYFEQSGVFNFTKVQNKNPELSTEVVPDYMLDSIGYAEKLQRPRLIKTHLPWDLLPKQIRNFEKMPKIIHVSRDARDVCCSYYYFYKFISTLVKGNFEDFVKLFLNNRVIYGSYWEHLYSFKGSDKQHILEITYEEMHADLNSILIKVAKFLGKDLTNIDLLNLNKHLSFDQMKNNKNLKNIPLYRDTDENKFMRAGKTNAYQNMMTDDILKQFINVDLSHK